jgi:hypothetical protein
VFAFAKIIPAFLNRFSTLPVAIYVAADDCSLLLCPVALEPELHEIRQKDSTAARTNTNEVNFLFPIDDTSLKCRMYFTLVELKMFPLSVVFFGETSIIMHRKVI